MAGGACTSAREVKAACGMKPGCGSCTRRLYGLISEYRDGTGDSPETAGREHRAPDGAPLTVFADAGRESVTAA